MGHVLRAIRRAKRDRDAACLELAIVLCRGERLTQRAVGFLVLRRQAGVAGIENIRLGQHRRAAWIGVNDPAALIDQKDCGHQPVNRVGERCRFHFVQVDDLADQHGAPKMRIEHAHATAHGLVGKALALMPHDR